MNATVYCPGPSLLDRLKNHQAGKISIAVNRAATVAPCDWWCAGDAWNFQSYAVRPARGICSNGSSIQHLHNEGRDWRSPGEWMLSDLRVHRWERLSRPKTWGKRGHNYSVTAAIALAADLGCDHITVFGCDMVGRTDWDGFQDRRYRRGEDRWERERADLAAIINHLATANVVVEI